MFWKTSPDAAAEKVVAALSGDQKQFAAAMRRLIKAAEAAKPDDLTPALVRLAPVLATAPMGRGSGLAQTVGTMAGQASNTAPVLGVLVERACQALEAAHRFRDRYSELPAELPQPEQWSAIAATLHTFTGAYPELADEAEALVHAWFVAGDWTQPVLFLCQRAEVRAALPQRKRLLAAVESMHDVYDETRWLRGLLAVVDDTPLIVLHRPTGRGYRLTIGGIGHNYQLHTLIAARLIGDVEAGWLPGTPPTPAMIAAADGSGDQLPQGGITNQFTLLDPSGEQIPEDEPPADLPVLEGQRVVILEPPAYPHGWTAGRAYPLMPATAIVDAMLSPEESAALLAMTQAPDPDKMQPVPAGWTDDLTIPLPPDRTVAQLVDYILQAAERGASTDEIERLLVAEFGLSADDATVAWDRAFGGLVRAGTRSPANCPDRDKDPIAWDTFHRGIGDPSLVKLAHRKSA